MPDGRFLSKSIAYSAQVGSVSLEADYLFMRMIPHLDSAGRVIGTPSSVKALCCPLRSELTVEVVEKCLAELQNAGLIVWYEAKGERCVSFPRFTTHQRGARLDREGPSRLPAPPTIKRGQLRTTPDNSGERRVSEVKLSEVKYTGADAPTPDEQRVLQHYVACHPRRKVGPKDVRLVRRRLAEGLTTDMLCDAITGNKADRWHAEKHKHELGYVLRDAGKVSEFAEKAQVVKDAVASGKDYWDNPELQRAAGGAL